MSTLFKRRQDEAEAVIDAAIGRLHVRPSLLVRTTGGYANDSRSIWLQSSAWTTCLTDCVEHYEVGLLRNLRTHWLTCLRLAPVALLGALRYLSGTHATLEMHHVFVLMVVT